MTALWEQFAAGIRAALERQQIRQHDLALALGVSDKHISRLLTGHGTPSWEMLDRITEQLCLKLAEKAGIPTRTWRAP